jgi:hypothetical protein
MIPTTTLKAETAQRQPNFRRDFMPYEPMENERSGQPNRGVRTITNKGVTKESAKGSVLDIDY